MPTAAIARLDVRTLTRAAVCAALIAVCSWISVPAAVPFTLQTFAVFLTCDLMGGAAILPVLVYILLGAAGLPVFAGFSGGPGVLLGPTGGYIIGFAAIALLMVLWRRITDGRFMAVGMAVGLVICYLFGTVWFVRVYAMDGNAVSFSQALTWCVLPYIVPDLIKLALARLIGARVRGALKNRG